jgi:hypothetical protein
MPRYYFHLTNGQERVWDGEGIELPEELLPDLVKKVLRDIQVETPDLFDGDHQGWGLEVVDACGHVIDIIEL